METSTLGMQTSALLWVKGPAFPHSQLHCHLEWTQTQERQPIKKEVLSKSIKRKKHTRILWSNCTVVGFSNMFFNFGEKARRSSGIQRSPILGNELYTRPASSPATNAPRVPEKRVCHTWKYECNRTSHLKTITVGVLGPSLKATKQFPVMLSDQHEEEAFQ